MTDSQFPADTFPRQQARTRRYTLGRPRIDHGGRRRLARGVPPFPRERRSGGLPLGLRRRHPDGAAGLRPGGLQGEEHISAEERDRRERLRETLTGVTDYATDRAGVDRGVRDGRSVSTWPTWSNGGARELQPAAATAVRSAAGSVRAAHRVRRGRVRSACSMSRAASDRELAIDDGPRRLVGTRGVRRRRGDGPSARLLVVARTASGSPPRAWTTVPSDIWHIAAPVDPEAPSRAVRYPAAGTDNAIVTLAVFDIEGGRVDVAWDVDAFPYLVTVVWSANGPLTFLVRVAGSEDAGRSCSADPDTGADDARPRGSRRPMAPHPARGSRVSRRRPPGADARLRGHPPADVRRRARDAGRSAGGGGRSRSATTTCCSARPTIPPSCTCGGSTPPAR